jgi:hypothetical protein
MTSFAPRPLHLPQYVIICGTNKQGNLDLARSIHERNAPDHVYIPSKAPVLYALATLAFADPDRAIELTLDQRIDWQYPAGHVNWKPDARPLQSTTAEVITLLSSKFEEMFGLDWIGRMLAKHAREGADDTRSDTLIWWDGDYPRQFAPLVEQERKEKFLFIMTGGLERSITSCDAPLVWLAHASLNEQMAMLIREVGED